MSEHNQSTDEFDPIEAARQVHTLAQRLLQHVTSDEQEQCERQEDPNNESNVDDQTVTYWYP